VHVTDEDRKRWPPRFSLFLRMQLYLNRNLVMERPQVQGKRALEAPQTKADRQHFERYPLEVEFYYVCPYRPIWHEWQGSVRDLVDLRVEEYGKVKKTSVEELRRLLGPGTHPDNDISFDAEGRIRGPRP
jgi:hypothetical protein